MTGRDDKVDRGPAVDPATRALLYTSASQIQSHDHEGSDGGCPRKFYFERVLGRKPPPRKGQEKGKVVHAELEHYEKTGEDVLGSIARAGKHLLPAVGPDLRVEDEFRFSAAGVPLVGYVDLWHSRGEYVDEAGELRRERPEHGLVVECIDHKTSVDVEQYAKSAAQLARSVQMITYGRYLADAVPGTAHVRQSHITYQTRGRALAKKTTALLSVAEVAREWSRVERVVEEMRSTARLPRVEDALGNIRACGAFGGCPHLNYCPKAPDKIAVSVLGGGQPGGNAMSLLTRNAQLPPGAAPQNGTPAAGVPSSTILAAIKKGAPPADADRAKQVAEEKARLEAEDRGAPPPTKGGARIPVSSCMIETYYLVDCEDGRGPQRMKLGSRAPSGHCVFFGDGGDRARLTANEEVFEIAALDAVVPPDAPAARDLVEKAGPVSAGAAAQVDDPALRAKVEDHNRAHAERATTQAAEMTREGRVAEGSRCPGGHQKVVLTTEQLADRRAPCPAGCGEVRPVKPVKEGEQYVADFPGHMVKKTQPAAEPPQSTTATETAREAAPQAAAETPRAAVPAPQAPAPAAREPATGIVLYVDVAFERGSAPRDLADYYLPLVRDLEQEYRAIDIRCAPQDTPLGYSKWRGALAACVRAAPPAAGEWVARNVRESEIAQVVLEALSPLCERVIRSVR